MHCYAPNFKEIEEANWFGPVQLPIHLPPHPAPPPPAPPTPPPPPKFFFFFTFGFFVKKILLL